MVTVDPEIHNWFDLDRWKFNNSAESIDIQQSHFTIERLRSTLTYKVKIYPYYTYFTID